MRFIQQFNALYFSWATEGAHKSGGACYEHFNIISPARWPRDEWLTVKTQQKEAFCTVEKLSVRSSEHTFFTLSSMWARQTQTASGLLMGGNAHTDMYILDANIYTHQRVWKNGLEREFNSSSAFKVPLKSRVCHRSVCLLSHGERNPVARWRLSLFGRELTQTGLVPKIPE